MSVDIDAPTTKEEQNFRAASLSKWMSGLKTALPNPSVAGGEPEPDQTPEPTPAPAAPDPTPTPSPTPAVPDPAPVPAAPQPEPISADRWPRSAKEWKNFTEKQKVRTDELQKQISERDAKIKELEAKTAGPIPEQVTKEIESLKKENDEFSKQLRLVSVTSHPRFKQYFENKTNNALAILKSCVPADQLDNATRLVQSPDSDHKNEQVNELLDGMSRMQQSRFLGVINLLSEIQAERDSEVTRAQQDYDQMMAQAKTQRDQQQAGFNKLLDDTVKSMQDGKTGRPEYQLRDGQTEWNQSVAKRIETGRKLISGTLPADVMFKAAFDAAAYADVLAGYKAALGEIDKLNEQLKKMTAANPTVQSPTRAQPTNGTGTTPQLPKDARPMDYTKRWVEKFGAAMRGEAI